MVVAKGKLKANMLEYFAEVERTGVPLIVMDGGRQVLEVRPIRQVVPKATVMADLRTQ